MNKKHLFLLLRIVKYNRSLNALLKENLTFKQIALLIENARNKNLIQSSNDKIIMTQNGELIFNVLSEQYKKTNKFDWIEKEKDSIIKPFDINFLYLPDQHSLNLD